MGWSKFWWWQLHSPRSAQECSGYLWRSECFSCFFGRWRQGVAWGCRTKQISDKGSTAGAAAACLAFASWGGPNCGCDSSRVQHLLLNVVNGNSSSRIVSPGVLVLWLWEIETLWHMVIQVLVVTARESQDLLRNVQQIYATHHAFAAILADGTVVTWGNPEYGGDSSTVQDQFSYV